MSALNGNSLKLKCCISLDLSCKWYITTCVSHNYQTYTGLQRVQWHDVSILRLQLGNTCARGGVLESLTTCLSQKLCKFDLSFIVIPEPYNGKDQRLQLHYRESQKRHLSIRLGDKLIEFSRSDHEHQSALNWFSCSALRDIFSSGKK